MADAVDLNDQEYEDYVADFLAPRPIEWAGIIIFTAICLIGVAGNCLVITVVASAKKMRTTMNVLLTNLAVADILILVFVLPTTILYDVTKTFWFSSAACKAVQFVQNTGIYVSVLSLTYISYERWRAVTNPLDSSSTNKGMVCTVIWSLAMVLSVPEPLTLDLVPAEFNRKNFTTTWGTHCDPSWSPIVEKSYQMIQTLGFYILPLSCISFLCYRTIDTLNSPQVTLGHRQIGSRKKAVRMLLVVVSVFALSYLPVHIHNISVAFSDLTGGHGEEAREEGRGGRRGGGDSAEETEQNLDLPALRKLVVRFFSYSSSTLNPILYNLMSRKFRKEYARLVLCRRRESQLQRTTTTKH